MSQAAIGEMTEALELEIKAVKKRGGTTQVEVRGGEYRGAAEGNFLYAFALTEQIFLRDESPIRVVVGQEEIEGTVVSLSEGVLIVALERDAGPKIPLARLIADDSFLLERLKVRLEDVLKGEAAFNHGKADQALGEAPPKSSTGEVDEELLLGGDLLNAEQMGAVSKALHSEVTYLWGPPGTGKTTVLARVVEGYYRAGLSVLVISNTNIAVDTALEKIAERLQSDPGFQQGRVLRHGPIVKPELDQRFGDQVALDRVVEQMGKDLQAEKASFEAERASAESEAAPLREAVQDHEALEEAKRSVSHFQASLAKTTEDETECRDIIDALGGDISSHQADLERAHSMGGIRRFLSGLDPERITRQLREAETERAAQERALSARVNEQQQLEGQLQAANENAATLGDRVRRHPAYDECRTKLDGIETEIDEIGRRVQEIEAQLAALRDEILKECRILATTVYRTYLKGQVERVFDAVVVDEASMLALPMVFYAAGLAIERVLIAGDFRQLPPITMSDDAQVIEWVKTDVFRKAGIAAAVGRGEHPEALASLQTQYRMHQDICSVVNRLFYESHPLETHSSLHDPEPDGFPLGDPALLYVDTGAHHPWTSQPLGTSSRYNVLHALLLRNIACHLSDQGYLSPKGSANERLGIIAPYRAQVTLLQRLLDERLDRRGSDFANTVHRFQGNEKDTILIDLTDSLGARPSIFVRAKSLDDDGARLLNVALSRARRHLLLVANFDFLRDRVGRRSVVGRILDLFEELGSSLDVDHLLQLGPEDWLDGLRPLEPPQIEFDSSAAGAFTEGTFYPAFVRDMKTATDSIVIFSPFLTERGTSRWTDIIRGAVSAGVRVRLVARPPGDQGGILEKGLKELLEDLMALGVVVDLRARMHEKFAIIDDSILWHGSLNIFSHRDTSESMLRIPSSAACRQMAQFVTSPARRKLGEDKEQVALAARENPECPDCSGLMVWKSGRYGVYFECSEGCGAKVDPRRSGGGRRRGASPRQSGSRRGGSSKESAAAGVCPECGSAMKQKSGRFGPFLGCTGYPRCRHTESV